MYIPSDDTFFMSEIIENFHGQSALEIGIGSGYLTKILCKNYQFVIGIDIDFKSVKYAKDYVSSYKNNFLICCDLELLPINYTFDIIISNPPYLPNDYYVNGNNRDNTSGNSKLKDNTIHGGQTGIEFTLKILQLFYTHINKDGKVVLIKSSLTENNRIDNYISNNSLKKKTIAKKKLFFETLEVLEITRN